MPIKTDYPLSIINTQFFTRSINAETSQAKQIKSLIYEVVKT
jgi:hypothetical protein